MKILLLIFLSLFLTGCQEKPFKELKDLKEEPIPVKEDKYVDNNEIRLGLYTRSNNKYTLWKEYKTSMEKNKDINTFQILPTNEEFLNYSGSYINFIEPLWNGINSEYELGIILEYELNDGNKIKHKIIDPSNTLEYQNYIQVYLYDAIAHKNDKWYSHITKEEFNEKSYITSFKLTAGNESDKIVFPIKLTIYSQDTEDDFTDDGDYRGNSLYSINIIKNN